MKRMSIAEQTLQKQVKALDVEIAAYQDHIDILNAKIDCIRYIRDATNREIRSLADARLAASTSRKP